MHNINIQCNKRNNVIYVNIMFQRKKIPTGQTSEKTETSPSFGHYRKCSGPQEEDAYMA